ncbi:TetR/AcrR family transcriptional regulator (plasmid) [Rhizobium lusitanum]|uniref:TetR/AcrR family transcriptional regulator n=1 Tax=Rhizobium lusitanum TaxID=293958 RepID=UPI00160AEDEF|nr:TetR/AcrR family transcriptional regulator [Rhizobium lusitanum]QND44512.1 TetR/AcrR family transcriptional regulator [Rhizobium lusitanum]
MARPFEFDPDIAVDRAMEVFWQKGYAGTTPQDLLDAAGIGKGSFYNHFKSKRNMFELCLQRYRNSQSDALVEFLKQPVSARLRLKGALEQLIRFDLEGPIRKGCMAVNTAAELAASDEIALGIVQGMFNRTEAAFVQLIEEGQSSGEFRVDIDAASLASLLFTTVLGLRIAGLVADTPDRLRRAVDAAIRVI